MNPGIQQTGQPSRAEYAREIVRALWPAPASVRVPGEAAGENRRRDVAGMSELVAIPSAGRPVLLLPRRPRKAAATALRHYKASAGPRGQLQFRLLALAARAGLAEVIPHRFTIVPGPAAPGTDIVRYLSEALGRDIVVSVYVGGPARANRKPVLGVLSPGGELLGFAKVGITPLARELVRAEAAALTVLNLASLTRLRAPRLLWHGSWQEHEVLVQEAFAGSGRPAGAALAGAMSELAGLSEPTITSFTDSPYLRGLRDRVGALGQHEAADQLLAALDAAETEAGPRQIAFGSWHGDWTPWNMTMSQGRVLLWDWERFSAGVPVGFDALHYRLQSAVVTAGTDPRVAAEQLLANAAEICRPLGVEPAAARLVARLYLAEIGARYLQDRQAEAGSRLGRIDTWLLPALTQPAARRTAAGPAAAGPGGAVRRRRAVGEPGRDGPGVLITGLPRSGTSWVGKMLQASREVVYVNEPLNPQRPPGRSPGVLNAEVSHRFQYICADNDERWARAYADTLRLRYRFAAEVRRNHGAGDLPRLAKYGTSFTAGRLRGRRALLDDPFAVLSAAWFAERLGCQVVVLVRSPVAFVGSWRRLGWKIDFNDLLDQPLLVRDLPGDYLAEMRRLVHSDDQVAKIALLWRVTYGTVSELAHRVPGLQVRRYEDLATEPAAGFRELYDRCGLTWTPQVAAQVRAATTGAGDSQRRFAWSVHGGLSKTAFRPMNSAAALHSYRDRLSEPDIERVRELTADVARAYYKEESG